MAAEYRVRLWLDDKRPMPAGFDVHVLKASHAAKLIRMGLVDCVSLDHDLGDESECGTGYEVACEIEALAMLGKLRRRLTVYVHSQNPVGVERMRCALANAAKRCDRIEVMP